MYLIIERITLVESITMDYKKLQTDWELILDKSTPISQLTFNVRWRRITDVLAKLIKENCNNNFQALDIGGGDGSFYFLIKDFCKLYINVEPSTKMIRRFKFAGHNYICRGCGEELPCKKEKFDVVILNSVLDHCINPRMVLFQARRVLRPGGKIFILLANDKAWYKKLLKNYNLNRKKMYQEHNFYFSSQEIKKLLGKESFRDIFMQHFDFLRLPIAIENLLFYLIPQRILLLTFRLVDQIIEPLFPCRGGSFICMAAK